MQFSFLKMATGEAGLKLLGRLRILFYDFQKAQVVKKIKSKNSPQGLSFNVSAAQVTGVGDDLFT